MTYANKTHVLIAHSGRQHSDQLVWALNDAGILTTYIHGAPLPKKSKQVLKHVKRHFVPIEPLVRILIKAMKLTKWERRFGYYAAMVFDYYTAIIYKLGKYDAVIGYETSCLRLFRAAKSKRALCILDAASMHHKFQDKYILYSDSKAISAQINMQKNNEIELANVVLTCSSLAARTYTEVGISSNNIVTLPLGANLPNDKPSQTKNISNKGKAKFLFVGSYSQTKGADILLEALQILKKRNVKFDLTVVATPNETKTCQEFNSEAKCIPRQSRSKLDSLYEQHDCLLLPSRFDSYGLVVVEALMLGTPSITSKNVGSSFIIENHNAGYVVDVNNSNALADTMQEFCISVTEWRRQRPKFRKAGTQYTWDKYRENASYQIDKIIKMFSE